ncbi:hypothetical protein AZE42_05887 [Rhizopogon vesiculosus]|uniref:Uncharacterized protein n=1 Tax=Rhizopogon vesiculosus TaxID=180088 RepID=A0A1J8Q9F5_9AGAM|nr:hypothetical protein AZE42_05887 [Rhizopogon vesiculosus]
MSGVPEEEKRAYVGNSKETGFFGGYKPRQFWHIDSGVFDQQENYNWRHIDKVMHPEALRPFLPDVRAFMHHNHYNILHEICRHVIRLVILR